MKLLLTVVIVLLALLAAAMLWVRLAPVNAARWHVDLTGPVAPRANAAFCPAPGARVTFPPEDMARLDAIALATPRTRVLAGSAAEGHVTYITRSALWGFPDYTTVQVRGGQICAVARQGIGLEDLGVNAARLGGWLQELGGLTEAPDLVWAP